jgi:transposase
VTTARSFLKHYEKTGKLEPKERGGNRRPVLKKEHLEWIQQQLDRKADLRVSDLVADIQKVFHFDKVPCPSTIDHAINMQLRYTLKVLKPEPADFNTPSRLNERKEWVHRFTDSGNNMFTAVYVDESGFNLHQNVTYGRAKRGERAVRTVPSNKGKNISYIAAVGAEGLIASHTHQGSTNGRLFAWFLTEKLFPKLDGRHRLIIMDNASIHKATDVRNAFAASHHTQVFLPPYSPFLNAAEWLFAHIKPRLSKEEYRSAASLFEAIETSAATVTSAHCTAWIREVNRNLFRAMNREVLGREHHYNMAEGDEDLGASLLNDLSSLRIVSTPRPI